MASTTHPPGYLLAEFRWEDLLALKLNERLGYQRLPGWLQWEKVAPVSTCP